MDWHSTRSREELIIALAGRVSLEVQSTARIGHRIPLRTGQCVFLPTQTLHRVVNRSRAKAQYLYVTAPSDEKTRRSRKRIVHST